MGPLNFRSLAANYVSLFLLLALTADALVANWRLNPIWDVFYARIQLNLFYNSHAASVLSMCFPAFYMIYRKDSIITAVFASFATGSIHELALFLADEGFFRMSSGVSWSYGLVMLAFLIIGWMKGKAYHRNVLVTIAILMGAWFFILGFVNLTGVAHIGSSINPRVDFAPTSDFYNPITNFAEVVSWLVPMSLWFLPRTWFYWKRESPP